MLDTIFTLFIQDVSTTFLNPQKRIFLGYLFCALILAYLWLTIREKRPQSNSLATIFSRNIWWSESAKSDYKILIINKLLMVILSPLLITKIVIAYSLFYLLHDLFPSRPSLFAMQPNWVINLLFTSTYFILDDFARFYIHRLMHRWPLLWAFHKVHHSAKTLTPLTVFRTHPIEMLLFTLRSTAVQAICIANFVFFMGEDADLITLFGANVFIFAFNLLGSNLRHSHIAISYWKPLEKIIISPAQHQIHHSAAYKHRDKNFGVILSIWDRLFGSFHHSEKDHKLTFGLGNDNAESVQNHHSLFHLYVTPFKLALLAIIKLLKSTNYQWPLRNKKRSSTQTHSVNLTHHQPNSHIQPIGNKHV